MERPIIMLNTDDMPVFCRNQCANTKCAKHITKAYECGGACSMQLLRGAAGVRRVHITEEKEMTQENVCKSCEYYESCGKPERYIKCMGYKERQQAAGEQKVDVQG